MTPKISLIIGIVAAALVLATPAVGLVPPEGVDTRYTATDTGAAALVFDNYRSETARPDFWNYDANGQKIASSSPGLAPQDLAKQFAGVRGSVSGRSLVFDNYRVEAQPSSRPVVTATDSGRGDWPQIGIGFALGVAMIGFLLVLRHMRIRPLAH